jgi:hypothetical protein
MSLLRSNYASLSPGKESKESVKKVSRRSSLLFFPSPSPLLLPKVPSCLPVKFSKVVGFSSICACLLSLVWLYAPGLLRLFPPSSLEPTRLSGLFVGGGRSITALRLD